MCVTMLMGIDETPPTAEQIHNHLQSIVWSKNIPWLMFPYGTTLAM